MINSPKKELAYRELARRRFDYFIPFVNPLYELTSFHSVYIQIMQAFITGAIRKLIISVPPQHGKSWISSRYLPEFLFGQNPSLKIAIMSYNTDRARRFGRRIKLDLLAPEFKKLFPSTSLPEKTDKHVTNAADIVDVMRDGSAEGNLFLVGRGGGLTGEPVDVLIMDDLYKNAMEAYSPVIQQSIIDMYNTVAESRLHNNSRQLIVFTRWHERDLVGYLEKNAIVKDLITFEQLTEGDPASWYRINFPALKTGERTDFDMRGAGDPLYPGRHSKEKLEATRDRLSRTQPEQWFSLYQGDPKPLTGLLYGKGFHEYIKLPDVLKNEKCVVDVADTGRDRICAICYGEGEDNYLHVKDIYYSTEAAEVSEIAIADMIIKNRIRMCDIESNAGGRQYARNIDRLLRARKYACEIVPFYQSANKEARITTNASNVLASVLFPQNWVSKYPLFAEDLLLFRSLFKANSFDDAPDCLTMCYERSTLIDTDDVEFAII